MDKPKLNSRLFWGIRFEEFDYADDDLDQAPDANPNLIINFDYGIYISGQQNPLGLYTAGTNNLLAGCSTDNFTYQLSVTHAISTNDGTNLFSYLENNPPGQINTMLETPDGNFPVTGTISGNGLTFNIPSGSVSTLNHLKFVLDLNTCPFSNESYWNLGYNGVVTFTSTLTAICNDCSGCFRTLDCIGGTQDVGSYLVVHCNGDCTTPGGAGTDDFHADRANFGWTSRENYMAYQISPAPANEPIKTGGDLATAFSLSDDALETELSKVYPHDLLQVHGLGTYDHAPEITDIKFEITYDPFPGAGGTEPLLQLVPNSAHVIFTFPDQSTQTFRFSDLLDFNAAGVLSFGAAPNIITVPASVLTLSLSNNQGVIDALNAYAVNAVNYEAAMDFYAVFRIVPENTMVLDPFDPGDTDIGMEIRGQFLTQLSTVGEIQKSCDSWGDGIQLLVPGAVIQTGTELLGAAIIDLPADVLQPENDATFDCVTTEAPVINIHSHCRENLAYGVHLFGGLGPLQKDFLNEFRPFAEWDNPGTLSVEGLTSVEVEVHQLYNADPTGVNLLINGNNFPNLPVPFMKHWQDSPELYSGLVFSIEKQSPEALVCSLAVTENPEISIDLPVKYFSSNPVHPGEKITFNTAVREVDVYTNSGQLISKQRNAVELNVVNLTSGIYLIRFLTFEGKWLTTKLSVL